MISGTSFYGSDAIALTQLVRSKKRRKLKILNPALETNLVVPSFFHHRTPDGRGVTAFMLAPW